MSAGASAACCLALAACLLCLGACRSGGGPEGNGAVQVEIGAVRWYVDYEAAQELARRETKPLWMHFGENPG